jgi:hypothetical protein
MDWWLLISYVGVLAVGGYLGYAINDWVIRKTFGDMMADAGLTDDKMEQFVTHWAPIMEPELEADGSTPSVQITLEQVEGDIYCYAKTTKEFLGQAKDREELIEVLTQRLGPVTLLVQPEDGADLIKDKTQ